MSFNSQMLATEPSSDANAGQSVFQYLVGMEHNFQDELFAEDVSLLPPADSVLLVQQPQLQAPENYSSDHNFLGPAQAFQTPDIFNTSGFDFGQNSDIPLNSDPAYVPRNIIESYTPGDRMRTVPLEIFGNWVPPTPFNPQPQFIQPTPQPLMDDPNEVPPQGLRKPPTWAEVASLPSTNNHPKQTPTEGVNKAVQLSMRREHPAPSVSMLSRPSDARSILSTSTARTGKRKRSPGPSPGPGAVSCDHQGCGKSFSDVSALNHHRKNHTKTENRPFKCEVKGCGLAFLWKKDLTRHETMHTKKKPFVCKVVVAGSYCEKAFSRHDNLRRHHNSAHPNLPCPSTNGSSQP